MQEYYELPISYLVKNKHLFMEYEAPDDPSNISYSSTGEIIACSIPKLIQKITEPPVMDEDEIRIEKLMKTTILTYPSLFQIDNLSAIAAADRLLTHLYHRYHTLPPIPQTGSISGTSSLSSSPSKSSSPATLNLSDENARSRSNSSALEVSPETMALLQEEFPAFYEKTLSKIRKCIVKFVHLWIEFGNIYMDFSLMDNLFKEKFLRFLQMFSKTKFAAHVKEMKQFVDDQLECLQMYSIMNRDRFPPLYLFTSHIRSGKQNSPENEKQEQVYTQILQGGRLTIQTNSTGGISSNAIDPKHLSQVASLQQINQITKTLSKKKVVSIIHLNPARLLSMNNTQEKSSEASQQTHNHQAELNSTIMKEIPEPILPSHKFFTKIFGKSVVKAYSLKDSKLWSWNTLEVARQMTIIDHNIFCRIRPIEYFQYLYKPKNMDPNKMNDIAPNIFALVHRANELSFFFAHEILSYDNAKKRCKALEKVIKLAYQCKKINNFYAVFALLGSLNLKCIHRLKKTWDQVDQKYKDKYEELKELLSFSANYKNLRNELKKCDPPVVPYIGIVLNDFLYITEANKDNVKVVNSSSNIANLADTVVPEESQPNNLEEVETKIVNIQKRKLYFDILYSFQMFQQVPYELVELPDLCNLVRDLKIRVYSKNNLAPKDSSLPESFCSISNIPYPVQGIGFANVQQRGRSATVMSVGVGGNNSGTANAHQCTVNGFQYDALLDAEEVREFLMKKSLEAEPKASNTTPGSSSNLASRKDLSISTSSTNSPRVVSSNTSSPKAEGLSPLARKNSAFAREGSVSLSPSASFGLKSALRKSLSFKSTKDLHQSFTASLDAASGSPNTQGLHLITTSPNTPPPRQETEKQI